LIALVALPASAAAQSSSISGVVRDPQQAVVPGAEVVLRNSRSAATPTAITDSAGRYTFAALPAGTYIVQVYLSGFEVQSSPEMVVGAEQSGTHDFVLALAGESQSITVVGTASPGYRVDIAVGDVDSRDTLHGQCAAGGTHRQQSGEELQGGLAVSAAHRLSGAAGV
jgi:hypothetical protein